MMRKPAVLFAVTMLLLLAAGLRFHQISEQSLWHDEGNSLRLAERDVSDLIEAAGNDIHPPGYYLMLKFWIAGAGDSELGLRSLSAFWSLLAVAALFSLGRSLYGPWAGFIAALLLAINAFAVYYAQEARMYAQLSALSILSLWILYGMMRIADIQLQRHGQPREYALHFAPWALALALVNTAGLYTHYMYPFTMLAQGVLFIWWTLGRNEPRARVSYISLNLLTLMLFQPWLDTAWHQITTWPSANSAATFSERLERIGLIIVYGINDPERAWTILLTIIPLLLLIAGFSLVYKAPHMRPSITWRLGLPYIVIGFNVAALLLSGSYRDANLKFLLPAQSGMLLLMGLGASRLRGSRSWRWMGRSIIAVAMLSLIMISIEQLDRVYNDPDLTRSDYRGIAQTIEATEQSDDAVILTAPNQVEVFSYYYNGDLPVFPLPPGLGGDDTDTEARTRAIIDEHSRILLVLWGQQERDPNNVVQHTLDQYACVYERDWYGDVELLQYAANPEASRIEKNVRFGENILLEGFTLSSDRVSAGEVLCITLFWQTDAPLGTRYKVSVQLLYPEGFLAEQHDVEPANMGAITTTWQPGETIVDNHGLTIQPDFPPGEYTLQVILYDPAQYDPNNPEAGRLSPEGASENTALFLYNVTIHQ